MKKGDQAVTKVTPSENTFTAHIDWQGDTTAPFLTEERRFSFTTPAKPFCLGIEMNSAIKAVSGEADKPTVTKTPCEKPRWRRSCEAGRPHSASRPIRPIGCAQGIESLLLASFRGPGTPITRQ